MQRDALISSVEIDLVNLEMAQSRCLQRIGSLSIVGEKRRSGETQGKTPREKAKGKNFS